MARCRTTPHRVRASPSYADLRLRSMLMTSRHITARRIRRVDTGLHRHLDYRGAGAVRCIPRALELGVLLAELGGDRGVVPCWGGGVRPRAAEGRDPGQGGRQLCPFLCARACVCGRARARLCVCVSLSLSLSLTLCLPLCRYHCLCPALALCLSLPPTSISIIIGPRALCRGGTPYFPLC